jgi:hypothetical protein
MVMIILIMMTIVNDDDEIGERDEEKKFISMALTISLGQRNLQRMRGKNNKKIEKQTTPTLLIGDSRNDCPKCAKGFRLCIYSRTTVFTADLA